MLTPFLFPIMCYANSKCFVPCRECGAKWVKGAKPKGLGVSLLGARTTLEDILTRILSTWYVFFSAALEVTRLVWRHTGTQVYCVCVCDVFISYCAVLST